MSDQYLPDGQSCGEEVQKKEEVCALQSHPQWTWVSVIIRSVVMGEEVRMPGDGSTEIGVKASAERKVGRVGEISSGRSFSFYHTHKKKQKTKVKLCERLCILLRLLISMSHDYCHHLLVMK